MRPRAEPLGSRFNVHADPQLAARDNDSVNFVSVLQFVQLRWRILTLWLAAAACAAICFVALSPAYYTASTTLLLQPSDARPQGDAATALLGLDPATYVYSQIELIQSDEVLERVVAQSHLTDDPEFGKPGSSLTSQLLQWARASLSPASLQKESPQQEATTRLRRALSIRRLGLSDAVEISVTAQSPGRAATLANAVAKAYVNGSIAQKAKAREDAAAALTERLAKLREKLYGVGATVHAPADANSLSAEQARERFRELQDSTEVYRNLYTAFLQREYMAPGADLASSAGRIITPAKPPAYRSSPRTVLVLVVAMALGGGVGFAHALTRHLKDQVVASVADLEPFTRLDRIRRIARESRYVWRQDRSAAKHFQPAYALRSNRIGDTLRKFAVRLQLSQDEEAGKVIGVVACNPGAGASCVAAHLASMLAEAGRKTLLLDANWRKPAPASRRPAGASNSEAKRITGTLRCGAHSLDVLTVRMSNPTSEFAASQVILDTIRQQRAEGGYDFIIVDFHSSDDTADMEAALATIEKLIVVTEARRTPLDSLRSALKSVPPEKLSCLLLNKA